MSGLPRRRSNGRKSTPFDKQLLFILILGNKPVEISICCKGGTRVTREEELIERLMKEDEDFIKIKKAHIEFARQLDELEKKPFLTPQDEMEIKIIKKKKLVHKDEMEKILRKYR
jgi:hypothetical protein